MDDDVEGVGAAKQRACAEARGEILVELDHDDLLARGALRAVYDTYSKRPDLALVFSHCAQVLEDGSRDNSKFNTGMGWEYREALVDGRNVQHAVSLPPTPHNVSYIWFAPNHLRAFSRRAYEEAGGYDPKRHVLDDQDLMCRLYQVGDFHLIDECLYLQRMHEGNTQRDEQTNVFIQTETVELYNRYIEGNAARRGPSGVTWSPSTSGPPTPTRPATLGWTGWRPMAWTLWPSCPGRCLSPRARSALFGPSTSLSTYPTKWR